MTDKHSDDPQVDNSPGFLDETDQPVKPRKRRRLRRWLIVGAVVLMLLLVLVLIAPMLLSTSPARSFVMKKVNESLNGRVAVDDWSLGWSSGLNLENVKVFDDQDRLILELDELSAPVSLLRAAGGNITGNVEIRGLHFVHLEIDANGRSNLEKLIPEDASARTDRPKRAAKKADRLEMPNVHGTTINLIDMQGTIHVAGMDQPIFIEPTSVRIDIPEINRPIETDARLVYRVGDAPSGSVTLGGTFSAVENNRLMDPMRMRVSQDVTLTGVDLAGLTPLLKLFGLDVRLSGLANGELAIRAPGTGDASVEGAITVSDLKIDGEAMRGDTYATSILRVPLKIARESAEGRPAVIRVETARVELDQGSIDLTATLPQAAIDRAITMVSSDAAEAPVATGESDASGEIVLAMDLDLAAIANQLPNLVKLAENTRLDSARFTHKTTISLQPQQVSVGSDSRIADVAATTGRGQVTLEPVIVGLRAAAPVSDAMALRDLGLEVKSGFASVTGGGESLAHLTVNGGFDLARLQEQFGDLLDLDDILRGIIPSAGERGTKAAGGKPQLRGTGEFTIRTEGDLTRPGTTADSTASFTLKGVRVTGVTDQPIEQPWLEATYSGKLLRGSEQFIDSIRNVIVTFQSGDPRTPTVDMRAVAHIELPEATAPRFRIDYINIPSLAQAQREFSPFIPALREMDLHITGGAFLMQAEGGFDGEKVTFSSPLTIGLNEVTIEKGPDRRKVIEGETIAVAIGGEIFGGAAPGAKLTAMSITSSSNLVSLRKSPEQDLVILPGGAGADASRGALDIHADLTRLNDLVRAFAGGGMSDERRLTGGSLDGALAFGRAGEAATQATGDFTITRLTIPEVISDERVRIILKATAPDDLSAITVSAEIGSRFATAGVNDARLVLTIGEGDAARPADVWEMLGSATITADVPDLPLAHALLEAIAPAGLSASMDDDTPPLRFTGGSAAVNATLKREGAMTNINVTDVRISNLALARGEGAYAFDKDIAIQLAAVVDTTGAAADASAIERIREVRVTELSGQVGSLMELSMPEPLVVSNPADRPRAKGRITGSGRIEPIASALEAMQGLAAGTGLPYRGRFVYTQALDTNADTITLVGTVDAENFRVMQDGKPAFREGRIEIANDLSINPAEQVANIKALSIRMMESQALGLEMSGGVSDWATRRQVNDATIAFRYDLEKLWLIIKPMMSVERQESFKDLKIAGEADRTIHLSGAFPAGLPASEAIRQLKAEGGIAIGELDYGGADVKNLDLQFLLSEGRIALDGPDVSVNNGTVKFAGLELDLTHAPPNDPQGILPLLNAPPGHKLVENVTLNPLLADTGLGNFVNPLFVSPSQARGLVDLTIVHCRNLPLGEAVKSQGVENSGSAEFEVSITEVVIGNQMVGQLLRWIDEDLGRNDAFTGNIRNGRIAIANGVVTQDITLQLDKHPMRFTGTVRMADRRLMPLNVTIPPTLLKQANAAGRDFLKVLPEGVTLPITGTTVGPQLAWDRAIAAMMAEAGRNALLNELGKNLGKGDKNKGDKNEDAEKEPPQKEDAQKNDAAEDEPKKTDGDPKKNEDPLQNLLEEILKNL